VAAAVLLAVAGMPTAAAQAIARGQALYETKCVACHERSVHRREARRAVDVPTLRAEVARWSANAGGDWQAEEIDAVTAYLNDRYYRYPCPPTICREPARAQAGRGTGTNLVTTAGTRR
jgi:mono/diheme cytochrome c family protein